MKLVKKILSYIALAIFGLALTLILVAELAENKVTKIALNSINKSLEAHISVEDIDFSLLKNFPFATVELQNVIISTDTDTLALVDHLFVSVETRPLINHQFIIKEVLVEDGVAHYQIYANGQTNFDVLLPASQSPQQETDTITKSPFVLLDKLHLKNLNCTYKDDANNIQACLFIDETSANLKLSDTTTIAEISGELRAKDCYYPNTKLQLMQETKVGIDAVYNNQKINIKNLAIETDGAKINLSGHIKQNQSIQTDIHIASSSFDIDELAKYIPDSLLQAYDIKQLKGLLSIQAQIKGTYNDSTMPKIDAKLNLHNGNVAMADYPTVNDIYLSAFYTNGNLRNNETTQLTLDTLAFASRKSKGLFSGSITNLDHIKYKVNSELNLNLAELLNHMPDSILEELSGEVNLQYSTHGQLPDKFDDAFTDYLLERSKVQVQLKQVGAKLDSSLHLSDWNGVLTYANKAFNLKKLNGHIPNYPLSITNGTIKGKFRGSISKLSSLKIDLSEFDVATLSSRISGSMKLSNPEHPNYSITTTALIDLAEFKPFAPPSLVKDMSGKINTSFTSNGSLNLDSIADQSMDILFNQSSINTQFKNVHVAMADTLMRIDKLNGDLALRADSLFINKLSGNFSNIAFGADSTQVVNIYNAYWLNQADTVKVDGYVNLGDIDYALVEALMPTDTTQVQTEPEIKETSEPSRYRFAAKGKVTAQSFKYNKALFTNLSALYNVSDSMYIADQIKFDAFKGHTNSSVKVQILPDNVMEINFRNSSDKIDVNQLLVDFNDFKEHLDTAYISHTQLSGMFSTNNLNGQITFINDSLDMNNIKLTSVIKLENGHLRNYPITKEMGEDYNIDDLDNLIFKTLETQMFVYKGAVYAPLTNIKTNTFDISLYGMQNFNLDCQYHLRFYLKEILRRGKTNRIEKRQSDKKKQTDDGGTKGLASLFAIYKVENGKTVKSALEGKDSKERKEMKRSIKNKEAIYKFYFDPMLTKYDTGVNNE